MANGSKLLQDIRDMTGACTLGKCKELSPTKKCGSTYLSSLEIEVLWVNEAYRGQSIASQLLKEMENEAKEAGCQLAHLTTYSFQAPQFYQKRGFVVCGEIDGFPNNIKLYTLKKLL